MARDKNPINEIKKKLHKAKAAKQKLLSTFNNDYDRIKDHFNIYRRTKNPINKKGYSAYRRLETLKRRINDLSKRLDDSIPKCSNCNRRSIVGSTQDYQLNLCTVNSNSVIGRRSYVFIQSTRQADNPIEYELCRQCFTHLTDDDTKIANEPSAIWPAFYWYILSSNCVHDSYSASYIWKFVPFGWRQWWFEEIRLQYPTYYQHISLFQPESIIVDRTEDMKQWKNAIELKNISGISKVCNELLIPNILCPWGCSEFLHHCGYIDIEIILQRYIEKCDLSVVDAANKLSTVTHTRDDYIHNSIYNYDMWLHNKKWKVLPTIVFVDGCPKISTCKDHNKGCRLIQIHCCRWKTNLSAPISDQLCHAVVQPRTVKNMKIGYNTTGYQMVEQRSSWKGPDSINISSVGKMDHNSILVQEAEARSYSNRTDMKNLIQRLIDDKKMTNDHAEGIEEFSQLFSMKVNYDHYKVGSNYVPAEIAMAMKEEKNNREIIGIVDDDMDSLGNAIPEYEKKFKRIWPIHIYPCQKFTSYGAKMYPVPSFQVKGSHLLWIVSSLLLHVECLWSIIA